MEFTIREAERKDMPAVLELIKELAAYENALDQVEIDVAHLEKEGFDEKNFKCFVADVNGKIEGMALVYFRFSTWKGRTIHLEDLIVREKMRGTGLGSALYKKVIEYSLEIGVKRCEWVVLDWNKPAIDFYERSGAKVFQNWNTVQMDEEAMKKFIRA